MTVRLMNAPLTPKWPAYSNALADWNRPEILDMTKSLCIGCYSPREKFHALHEFVRDEIPFGFNTKGHLTKASEVLEEGIGYGNTKTTLLLAMSRAAGIPARVRFGKMRSSLLKGFIAGLPPTIPHSHLEVQLEGFWRPVDTYILDRPLALAALRHLKQQNLRIGYGLAMENGLFSIETCLDGQGFLQMGGIVEDHGTFDDPIQFYQSPLCKPHDRIDGGLSGWLYRRRLPELNERIGQLRMGAV